MNYYLHIAPSVNQGQQTLPHKQCRHARDELAKGLGRFRSERYTPRSLGHYFLEKSEKKRFYSNLCLHITPAYRPYVPLKTLQIMVLLFGVILKQD